MKIKTQDLIDNALDWVVTKIEMDRGVTAEHAKEWAKTSVHDSRRYQPYSSDWSWGGDIIKRECLSLINAVGDDVWSAYPVSADPKQAVALRQSGPTPLIAAMRCYVASKLGDEVEVPDGLV